MALSGIWLLRTTREFANNIGGEICCSSTTGLDFQICGELISVFQLKNLLILILINFSLTHTHHVGIDAELFWVAPFLIFALYKWPRKGLNLIVVLAVASTLARYYVTYKYNLSNYVSFGIRSVML